MIMLKGASFWILWCVDLEIHRIWQLLMHVFYFKKVTLKAGSF